MRGWAPQVGHGACPGGQGTGGPHLRRGEGQEGAARQRAGAVRRHKAGHAAAAPPAPDLAPAAAGPALGQVRSRPGRWPSCACGACVACMVSGGAASAAP